MDYSLTSQLQHIRDPITLKKKKQKNLKKPCNLWEKKKRNRSQYLYYRVKDFNVLLNLSEEFKKNS